MAQADILLADRLNPRQRNNGGLGDTPSNLGLLEKGCVTELTLSPRGKITALQLTDLIWRIVYDKNLVIREDQQELQGSIGGLSNRNTQYPGKI